jgi:hypothetical protein
MFVKNEGTLEVDQAQDVESKTDAETTQHEDRSTSIDQESDVLTNETITKNPQNPRKHNKKRIIGTVFVVFGLLVISLEFLFVSGYDMIHQPEFCNRTCHKPMDSYVNNYNDPTQKNLLNKHAEAGVTCMQCHNLSLQNLNAFRISWKNDNYVFNSKTKMLDSAEIISDEYCAKAGCHTALVTDDVITIRNGMLFANPHRDTGFGCTDCHNIHRPTVLKGKVSCDVCHGSNKMLVMVDKDFKTREGFIVKPHIPVDRLAVNPSESHITAKADIITCRVCHGEHMMPIEASKTRVADISYCYRSCHHVENFDTCAPCHDFS